MVSWLAVLLILVSAAALLALVLADRRAVITAHHARRLADGTQEARVIVDRGYRPSRIDLVAGVPTTLRFERREDDPCSELLVSEMWPSAHRLAPLAETEIHFTPERPGRYVFTCGMGMYSGELLVHGQLEASA